MEKILVLLSLIPWVLCYFKECLYYMKKLNFKDYTLKKLKSDIIKMNTIYKIVLIGVYVFFYGFHISLVNTILFFAITTSILISTHNTKAPLDKELNTIITIITLVITAIPFMYYFLSDDLLTTHLILIIYLVAAKYIIVISNIIYKKLPRGK